MMQSLRSLTRLISMSNSCIVAWLLGAFLAWVVEIDFMVAVLVCELFKYCFWGWGGGGGGGAGLVTRAELKITGGHLSNLLFVRA